MKKYLVVIEKADHNYSAFTPDIPGCITVGHTIEETIANMKEAMELAIEVMLEDGEQVPQPKGWLYHINAGVFNEGEIAEEYYIAQVEVELPQLSQA